MRLLGLAAVMLSISLAWASPVERPVLRYDGQQRVHVEGKPAMKRKLGPMRFKGGEKACVIAQGDQKPPVDLGLQVYNSEGRLVAQDAGKGDYAAAIWYPHKDEDYTIFILNPQMDYNLVYVVIK